MSLAPLRGSQAIDPAVTDMVLAAITDGSPKGIAAAVNRLIRADRLVVGDRLPTVRDLAAQLGVSPATVSEAWQALSAVGAIESRGRAGTYVRSSAEPSRPIRYLSIGLVADGSGVDLSTSMPDAALLPPLDKAFQSLHSESLRWTTSYLDDPVLPELGDRLRSSWPYASERIVTVDGALDGLSRVIDEVVGLGDRVAVEDPGFPALLDLLEARGAELIPVELDDQGMVPESLESALTGDPVAVFMHSRAQNPTGASLTHERGQHLTHILATSECVVVEADHSGLIARAEDLSLGSHMPDRVVHIRSYSKSHGPDLRIAGLSGPPHIVDPLMARRMLGPGWTSRILQSLLVALLDDPDSNEAVSRARNEYSRRTQRLTERLEAKGVHVHPGDGVNLWVGVRDERATLLMLAAEGIRVAPGSPFSIRPTLQGHIRVTVAQLPGNDSDQAAIADRIAAAATAESSPRGGVS